MEMKIVDMNEKALMVIQLCLTDEVLEETTVESLCIFS